MLSHRADGVAYRLKYDRRTLFVGVVIDGSVLVNAVAARCFYSVDVGADEQKFPARLLLLFDQAFDILGRVSAGTSSALAYL